jgi:hypothetical protein
MAITRHVFGLRRIAEHPLGQAQQDGSLALYQRAKSRLVASQDSFHEIRVTRIHVASSHIIVLPCGPKRLPRML